MDGELNIRPPYQREFVYDDKKRNEVIRTILRNLPLNTFWFSKNNQGTYEVLDGQQRSISFLDYIVNKFAIDYKGKTMHFKNLPQDIKQKILNYKIDVFICEGTDSEQLDWFKIINIAGEKLTPQELRTQFIQVHL